MDKEQGKPPLTPLQKIKQGYVDCLNLSLDDQLLPDYLISILVSNLTPALDEPVWGHIIGPPSTSKTESLRPFMESTDCVFVSSMTENALLSGYTTDDGEDPSLILKLNHKILIWKDLTTLINDNPQKVSKILGDLRDAYDGTCAKPSGKCGLRTYVSKFGVLAAVTNSIDAFSEDNQQLGERFVSFRTYRYATTAEQDIAFLHHVKKSTRNKNVWRATLRSTVLTELARIKQYAVTLKEMPYMTQAQERQLMVMSYLLSQLRTTPVKGQPADAEMGSRVAQQLYNIGCAHAISDFRTNWDETDMEFIRRVVIDTFTVPRRRLLIAMYGNPSTTSVSLDIKKLAILSRMPQQYLTSTLIQWRYCNLISSLTQGESTLFSLTPEVRKLITECKLLHTGPHMPTKTNPKDS